MRRQNCSILVVGQNGSLADADRQLADRTVGALDRVLLSQGLSNQGAELARFWADCSESEGRRLFRKTHDLDSLRQCLVAAQVLRSYAVSLGAKLDRPS